MPQARQLAEQEHSSTQQQAGCLKEPLSPHSPWDTAWSIRGLRTQPHTRVRTKPRLPTASDRRPLFTTKGPASRTRGHEPQKPLGLSSAHQQDSTSSKALWPPQPAALGSSPLICRPAPALGHPRARSQPCQEMSPPTHQQANARSGPRATNFRTSFHPPVGQHWPWGLLGLFSQPPWTQPTNQ